MLRAFVFYLAWLVASTERSGSPPPRRVLLAQSSTRLQRVGRAAQPDPYVSTWQYSYRNPNVQLASGWSIDPPPYNADDPLPGGNFGSQATNAEHYTWDGAKWAWQGGPPAAPAAPAPAFGPDAAVPKGGNGVVSNPINCGKMQKSMGEDYPDSPTMNCHPFSYYGGDQFVTKSTGCECYVWTNLCPYETCTIGNMWEGKYCVDPKAQNEYKIIGISKWMMTLNGGFLPHGGYTQHPPQMSLCLYWIDKPANPGLPAPPLVDPQKWKRETTVLAFQGTTLANCYKAFDASVYEKGVKSLLQKLGVGGKVEVLYAMCVSGGASPEWKFIQLAENTTRHKHVFTARSEGMPRGEFLQLQRAARAKARAKGLQSPTPCVDDPSGPGCPTEPPVMFPYTPTATLNVEVIGRHADIAKAQKASSAGDFCFDAPNDVSICAAWKSGEKCCQVAPPTQPPPGKF